MTTAAKTVAKSQANVRFFNKGEAGPSLEERKWMVSPDNPACPLNKYVGNEDAKSRLRRAAIIALGRHNHCCSDKNYALFGPAGVGKTTLPKLFADTLGVPFVKLVAGSIRTIGDLLQKIDQGLSDFSADIAGMGRVERGDLKLVPFRGNEKERVIPPCIVFIDEVHDLAETVVNGMLTATENADRYMVTESGITVHTDYVCFIIATTNREMLFDPFDTRFTKLYLRYYSTPEMGQIIKLKNPDWTDEMAGYVARYASRVPREADDFAKDVREEMMVNGGHWKDVVDEVARQNEVELIPEGDDEFRPMTKTRLAILRAVAEKGPVSLQRLQHFAGENSKTLQKYTLPWLMEGDSMREPLLTTSSRGFALTPSGAEEARKRGIKVNEKALSS